MLAITVPALDLYDEAKGEFVLLPEIELSLEHSLVSLSKWESMWEKPFLAPGERSTDETLSYVACMSLTSDIPSEILYRLSNENIDRVNEYISAKMTATWFKEEKTPPSREIITAELIYYWMIALTIPFECQHWHLNRLTTLIKVCNQKNAPQKKMNKRDLAARNRALNEQRQAALKTTG